MGELLGMLGTVFSKGKPKEPGSPRLLPGDVRRSVASSSWASGHHVDGKDPASRPTSNNRHASVAIEDRERNRQEAQRKREEIYRIKEILREVDTDGSGTMEWSEFLDFFKRAGFLLEYAEDSRNQYTNDYLT